MGSFSLGNDRERRQRSERDIMEEREGGEVMNR